MLWLEYRLNEIYATGPRRALFADMADAMPDLRAFLDAVHVALEEGDNELRDELEDVRRQLEDAQEDYYAADAANDDLRADVAYWKEQAKHAD